MPGEWLLVALVGLMISFLRQCGRFAAAVTRETGRATLFLLEALGLGFLPPYRGRRLLRELHFIGCKSLSIIFLTGFFTGSILALQGYYTLRKYGSESALGAAVALSLVRELGPVLTALMVAGRAGTAITAEIGIMRITEQVEALDTMGVHPLQYLVTPKLLASLVAVPLLTAIFDVVGILGGYLVGVRLLGVGSGNYFHSMRQSVAMLDINGGLTKSLVFGLTIMLVATYNGYFTGKGAEGVSEATTRTVVVSAVLILAWDYILTSFFM